MSRPIPVAPFCGHGAGQDAMKTAINDFVEALGKVFGRGGNDGDSEPEEPSSLVTITKKETTYEFDAEGLARAFAKTLKAVTSGRWPERSSCKPCEAHEPPEAPLSPDASLTADALIRAFFAMDTKALEGPDGKLKPEVLRAIVSAFEGVSPSVAISIVSAVIPEKYRPEVLLAFKVAKEAEAFTPPDTAWRRRMDDLKRRTAAPKPPEAQPDAPASEGGLTPGGHRIICVKELDNEFLKKQFPNVPPESPDFVENRFEVHIDVGDHRPAAVFRGKTKEAAIKRADSSLAISGSIHEQDEGMAQDDIDYEGDLRDKPPTDV